MPITETFKITPDNIEKESYYNQIQIANITGYTQPEWAFKSTGETLLVKKDHLGNIIGKV